jgi:hypothetical protein
VEASLEGALLLVRTRIACALYCCASPSVRPGRGLMCFNWSSAFIIRRRLGAPQVSTSLCQIKRMP